jgi:uncharacterized OB-fold protein
MAGTVEMTIQFPYKRSLGPVIGAFMTGLTERRLIGIRNGGQVMCPPLEWDPETGKELAHDFVDVGPAGTVQSWTWVAQPGAQHPLDRPFAFALIKLDGADSSLMHAVDAGSIDAMRTGMRVAPRWRAERKGHMTDIEAFVPGEQPSGGDDGGAATEPVTMMDYHASITYRIPTTRNAIRADQAIAEGRFLGLKCPACGRVYTGGKGYCPVDTLELTEEHEVDLPQRGTVSNFTIVTPIQYPGQTETEPFARVHVLLDDVDVVLGYQPLIEVANDDIRIGMRVEAVWASDAEKRAGSLDPRLDSNLVGWIPTGEPDVQDPDLVNRIN